MNVDKSLLSKGNVVDFRILSTVQILTVSRIIDQSGRKRWKWSVKLWITIFYRTFFKNRLFYMNGRLSKICSVHTYVMTRKVYFDRICIIILDHMILKQLTRTPRHEKYLNCINPFSRSKENLKINIWITLCSIHFNSWTVITVHHYNYLLKTARHLTKACVTNLKPFRNYSYWRKFIVYIKILDLQKQTLYSSLN